MRLGLQNHNAKLIPFLNDETLKNTLVVGKPQSGKTTLLCNLALDDIHDGKNVAFIDINGTGFDTVLSHIPDERQEDVIIFDASDRTNCFSLNILDGVKPEDHGVLISTLLAGFKSVWGMSDVSTANINQYIRATLDTLLKCGNKNLLHILPLLMEEKNRKTVLDQINSRLHSWFWGVYGEKEKKDRYSETSSTLNKMWELVFDPLIRNVVIQKSNHLTFKNKIVLVKLPVSDIGVENAKFLGALVLTQLSMDAREGGLNVYLDDCHVLGSSLLDRIISTFPRYDVSLTVSLTYLDQLPDLFIPSLIGGMGTLVSLRTSVKDTRLLEQEYDLTGEHEKLHQIPPHEAYVRGKDRTVIVDMEELRHTEHPKVKKKIINRCISQYTTPLAETEKRFVKFCDAS